MEIPRITLPRVQAETLERLLKRECIVHSGSVEKMVFRLRQKLRPFGIVIESYDSQPSFYRLTKESKAILRGMMKKEAA